MFYSFFEMTIGLWLKRRKLSIRAKALGKRPRGLFLLMPYGWKKSPGTRRGETMLRLTGKTQDTPCCQIILHIQSPGKFALSSGCRQKM